MRIIVMSDSHGSYRAVESIIMRNTDAEWFIHLGDGERELDRFVINHPELAMKLIHVAGNCDSNSLSPSTFVLPLLDHKIFAAHGHMFNVGWSLDGIKKAAVENGCDIILFGHTHVRFQHYEDGIYFMNPGSAALPRDSQKASFGCIDVSEAGIIMNIADV